MKVKVAIVILNWNGESFLKKYVPGILKSIKNEDYKLYVVDNNSTDNSLEYLKTVLPGEQILLFDTNYGYAGGYAKALKIIKSTYFVLLNSDVEVTENWIEPIIEVMDKDKTIAAAMPKIKWEKNREYFEYAGAAGGYIDRFGFPFCRGRILKTLEKDMGQYNNKEEIFWASGACMFVRSDLYQDAGGLDAGFFAHMEEIDLCWRLKNKGYKIIYIPDSTVYHVGGGTLSNDSPRKLYLNYRNNLIMLYKNLTKKQFSKVFFSRAFLDLAASIKFLLSFSFKKFWSVIKAYNDFNICKRNIKRPDSNQKLTESTKGFFPGSILISYFLKRRKYFSQLMIKR